MTKWLKRIFFPPPDPSLAVFEVAVKHAFAETRNRIDIKNELDCVKEELVQVIRDRDQVQSGWLTCRVCGARGEVHTCDYCHAARCRERDDAQAETRLIASREIELIRERDEARAELERMKGNAWPAMCACIARDRDEARCERDQARAVARRMWNRGTNGLSDEEYPWLAEEDEV